MSRVRYVSVTPSVLHNDFDFVAAFCFQVHQKRIFHVVLYKQSPQGKVSEAL